MVKEDAHLKGAGGGKTVGGPTHHWAVGSSGAGITTLVWWASGGI
jgi:hypothetical protein